MCEKEKENSHLIDFSESASRKRAAIQLAPAGNLFYKCFCSRQLRNQNDLSIATSSFESPLHSTKGRLPMATQKLKIAYYLRSATGNEEDLRRQQRYLQREFVKRKADFTDASVEIYVDKYQSGLKPGPEFVRMCDDAIAGKINVVMTERINRISRSANGMMKFYRFLKDHRIRFLSPHENVDSKYWHFMRE